MSRSPGDVRFAGISGCSGVWQPPSKDRNNEACNQGDYLAADLHPEPDRRGISMMQPNPPRLTTTIRENQDSRTRFFSRQGRATDRGCNSRTNRLRRRERRSHNGKTAFKHPFIKWRHAATNLPPTTSLARINQLAAGAIVRSPRATWAQGLSHCRRKEPAARRICRSAGHIYSASRG
jgi:hypothetical protein